MHTETWDNGDTYTGNYVNGQRTGKGIYKWNTGASYEGDFVNAELDGKGTYIWKNGDRFQVTGKMVLEQEKVLSLGQMEPNMKGILVNNDNLSHH